MAKNRVNINFTAEKLDDGTYLVAGQFGDNGEHERVSEPDRTSAIDKIQIQVDGDLAELA